MTYCFTRCWPCFATYSRLFLIQELMLPQFLSKIPQLVMIGSSCLKPFHAAVMCALVASTQPSDSPIMSQSQINHLLNPEVAGLAKYWVYTNSFGTHTVGPFNISCFLVGFWSSPDEPSILVLPTFILRPRVSKDVLQACNCIFKSSKSSLMMTRSSPYRSSQGQPIQHSQERASITIPKSSRLKTEPWCTPTVPSNLSLKQLFTLTLEFTPSYISYIVHHAIHSSTTNFLISHQRTGWGTWSKTFSRSTKAK